MVKEIVIFKSDLASIGLPTEDIDGSSYESILESRDELDWYATEVLEPAQIQPFIQLLSKSWFPVGAVDRNRYEPDDDDHYSDVVHSVKYRFSDHFYKENPSYYAEHFS
jgi:hypothetical protein